MDDDIDIKTKPKTPIPDNIAGGLSVLNTDSIFNENAKRTNEQLTRADFVLKKKAKDLLHKKFNLHSIYKKATENDYQDLTLLLNYILI